MFLPDILIYLYLFTCLAVSQSTYFDPLQYVDQLIGSGKDGRMGLIVWSLQLLIPE